MQKDAGITLTELRVDGGAAANDLLMQFQADLLGVPVVRPKVLETTALGAAYLAGLAVGYWTDAADVAANWRVDRSFEPAMPRDRVAELRRGLEQGGRAGQGLGVGARNATAGESRRPGRPRESRGCLPRWRGPPSAGGSSHRMPTMNATRRADWRTPAVVLVSSGLILTLSMGIRHGFGLFLQPMSADLHWGRETFALRDGRAEPGVGRDAAVRRHARRPLRHAPRRRRRRAALRRWASSRWRTRRRR